MHDVEPWHEDDSFWEAVDPVLFGERRWANAPGQVEQIIALLGIKEGARILDLCCGVGRHSLELARRGLRVTGVDRTKRYLDRASERARTEGLEIEFVLEDMRTFCRPDAFDATVNLFTSFGYFEDAEQDRQVAMNVYRSLRADGSFLVDVMGKEILARIYLQRDWDERDGGLLLLEERQVTRNWSWVENRWIIVKGAERHELKLSHRIYSAVELASLLSECGFARVDVYGDLAGNPYDNTARRLVVAAYK